MTTTRRIAIAELLFSVLPAAASLLLVLPLVLLAVLNNRWWFGLIWLSGAIGVRSLMSIVRPRMRANASPGVPSAAQIAGLVPGAMAAIYAFANPGFREFFGIQAALALIAAMRHTLIAVTGSERDERQAD